MLTHIRTPPQGKKYLHLVCRHSRQTNLRALHPGEEIQNELSGGSKIGRICGWRHCCPNVCFLLLINNKFWRHLPVFDLKSVPVVAPIDLRKEWLINTERTTFSQVATLLPIGTAAICSQTSTQSTGFSAYPKKMPILQALIDNALPTREHQSRNHLFMFT